MSLFNEGWPKEEIFDKFEKGEELTGKEALAFLAAAFSNATKNNYDAQSLFERVGGNGGNYSIKIKKSA